MRAASSAHFAAGLLRKCLILTLDLYRTRVLLQSNTHIPLHHQGQELPGEEPYREESACHLPTHLPATLLDAPHREWVCRTACWTVTKGTPWGGQPSEQLSRQPLTSVQA